MLLTQSAAQGAWSSGMDWGCTRWVNRTVWLSFLFEVFTTQLFDVLVNTADAWCFWCWSSSCSTPSLIVHLHIVSSSLSLFQCNFTIVVFLLFGYLQTYHWFCLWFRTIFSICQCDCCSFILFFFGYTDWRSCFCLYTFEFRASEFAARVRCIHVTSVWWVWALPDRTFGLLRVYFVSASHTYSNFLATVCRARRDFECMRALWMCVCYDATLHTTVIIRTTFIFIFDLWFTNVTWTLVVLVL